MIISDKYNNKQNSIKISVLFFSLSRKGIQLFEVKS